MNNTFKLNIKQLMTLKYHFQLDGIKIEILSRKKTTCQKHVFFYFFIFFFFFKFYFLSYFDISDSSTTNILIVANENNLIDAM